MPSGQGRTGSGAPGSSCSSLTGETNKFIRDSSSPNKVILITFSWLLFLFLLASSTAQDRKPASRHTSASLPPLAMQLMKPFLLLLLISPCISASPQRSSGVCLQGDGRKSNQDLQLNLETTIKGNQRCFSASGNTDVKVKKE